MITTTYVVLRLRLVELKDLLYVIPAGQTSATLALQTQQDAIDKSDGTIIIAIVQEP